MLRQIQLRNAEIRSSIQVLLGGSLPFNDSDLVSNQDGIEIVDAVAYVSVGQQFVPVPKPEGSCRRFQGELGGKFSSTKKISLPLCSANSLSALPRS